MAHSLWLGGRRAGGRGGAGGRGLRAILGTKTPALKDPNWAHGTVRQVPRRGHRKHRATRKPRGCSACYQITSPVDLSTTEAAGTSSQGALLSPGTANRDKRPAVTAPFSSDGKQAVSWMLHFTSILYAPKKRRVGFLPRCVTWH